MKRTFAFADLHGRYDLYQKIEEYVSPEDTLICLGDCIDRGPDGIKIVDALKQRENTIYIKGNHEDMAAAAIPSLLSGRIFNDSIDLWFFNCGEKTWDSIEGKNETDYAKFFDSLPVEFKYINKIGQEIILTHAGGHPSKKVEIDPIWNRKHFHLPWPQDIKYQDTFYVHGHTPVQYLKFEIGYDNNWPDSSMDIDDAFDKWDPQAIWYAGGHKVDIDLGSAFTGKTVLLDLDTFEEIYLKV